MIKMSRILCPVDFSPFSRRALDHAAVLAQWYASELEVVHVVPFMPTIFGVAAGISAATLGPSETEALRRELQAFTAATRDKVPNLEIVLREGSAPFEILRQADDTKADLIVLGTHGRSGFERWILGSVTEKVLRKACCPVLTVPPTEMDGAADRPRFRRVMCPVDFSDASAHAAQYALSLAQEGKAHVTFLHVVEWLPSDEFDRFPAFDTAAFRRHALTEAKVRLEQVVPAEARDWCEPEERISCGKPYQEILRLAAAEGSDLIVMGSHGRGPVDRLLFGSTTQHVVRQATCPVLTVRS
jgi:nucleotide-binding universal stress UspA family protein